MNKTKWHIRRMTCTGVLQEEHWSAETIREIELETGIRGGGGARNAPKVEGGVNILKFSTAPEIDPFLQRFYKKSPLWGSKVQVFQGQFFGPVPPL